MRRINAWLIATTLAAVAMSSPSISNGSEFMDKESPIKVTLQIDITTDWVGVRTCFTNTSAEPVLVKEGVYGFGIRDQYSREPVSPDDPEFLIKTSDGRHLRYKGYMVNRAPFSRKHFEHMRPYEVIDSRYHRIDNIYHFLPGTHRYTIIHYHLEYDLETDEIVARASEPTTFIYTGK